MSSPDHPEPAVFGGIPRRHPKSSSEDDQQLHPLAGLSEVWGKGPLDRPCSNLCSPHILATSHSSSSPQQYWPAT